MLRLILTIAATITTLDVVALLFFAISKRTARREHDLHPDIYPDPDR